MVGAMLVEESRTRNYVGGILEEECWRRNPGKRNPGEEILEEESLRWNPRGGILEDESWRRNLGRGILEEES